MKVQDYAQMIGYITRDKTTDVPGSMAHELKMASVETDKIKEEMNKKFGPGTMKYGSEIKQPEMKIPQAIFEFGQRNPAAEGGRIGFDNGGKTSKVKTKEFQYPVKFKNLKTGEIETVYRKEPIDYEARGKRVSTKVDTYKTALDDFQKQVDDAIQSKDVSKLPKSFAQFLKDKGLKSGTYFALLDNNQIPKIETDTSKIRLNFANNLIKEANQGFKFINAETLFKDAGFTSKEYKSLYATKQLLRLNKAEDKVGKSFVSLIHPRGSGIKSPKIVDLFNPVEKIAELTGLNRSIVSKRLTALNIKKESPDLHRIFKLLGNPNFKKNISTNFPDVTLTQLMMQPKSFFADYAQSKAASVRKGRLETAAKKAGEGVADINAAQDETIALLNKFYKENPQELLGNTKLRNLLDLTLEDGEIVKKNKYVKDEDFLKLIKEKSGLFTKDHVDEVQFEKLSTEFPVFRQLATYNTNSGLIRSIKSYISKNQNNKDPVVQDKIKKQIAFLEDLKLRVDTPTGRVGSKEVLAAVDRKAGTLPNFLAQLRALNIKLPAKAKAALLGTGGALATTTLSIAGPIEETGSTAVDTAKTAGAATAGALGFGTKTGRQLLGKGLNLATGPTGMFALTKAFEPEGGYDLSRTADRLGFEAEAALAPTLVKGVTDVSSKIKNPLLRKGIETLAGVRIPGLINPANVLRAARVASPIGIASLAGEGIYELGKRGYDQYQQMQGMTESEKQNFLADQYEDLGGVFGEGA